MASSDPHASSVLLLSSQVSTVVFGRLHLPAVPGEGLLDEGLDSRVSVSCSALKDEARLFSADVVVVVIITVNVRCNNLENNRPTTLDYQP